MDEPTTPGEQSSSASFRESDIEFLRTQAREWLEAVLGEDLDDHTILEDLLADGTLLYKVSQHIKEDSKYPGHVESSSFQVSSPSVDRKNSMKYQPYSYVESFLNVCKEVGLRDVDLFNPSDAVEKKDIRRVCVCLRRLSKKGRKLDIQVPDFDNVKATVTTPATKMPTEAVQRTRDSLQQSASRSASKTSANGQVSKETSSSIADLRKDDTESEALKPSVIAETFNKVHNDLDAAAEDRMPVYVGHKYKFNVAEPAVDTLPLADHDHVSQELVDRNGEESASKLSSVSKDTELEEEPEVIPQRGLFIAHMQGRTTPFEVVKKDEKDDENGGFPWLALLGGVAAIAGGIAGVVFLKKQSGNDDNCFDKAIVSGQAKLRNLRGSGDHSDSGSDSDSDDDNHSASKSHSGGVYKVRRGDNLTKIAKKKGKKHWSEITNKNPSIGDPDLIYPGDRLKV